MRMLQIEDLLRDAALTHQGPLPTFDASPATPILQSSSGSSGALRSFLAPFVVPLGSPGARRRAFQDPATELPVTHLVIGQRFSYEMADRQLWKLAKNRPLRRVLAIGTALGFNDAEYFTRNCDAEVYGIDYHNFASQWQALAPVLQARHARKFHFSQQSIAKTNFPNDFFDLQISNAVVEHLVKLDSAVAEMARITVPGGLALHSFGPLYCVHGGDHVSPALGAGHGYDHLLLSEAQYQKQIAELRVGAHADDAYWAQVGLFSYARVAAYFAAFERHFHIRYSVATVSQAALDFRARSPQAWTTLLGAGLSEADLLVDGLTFVLEKRA